MLITGAICDKCRKTEATHGIFTKKLITKAFREKGWSIGKQTICLDCEPKSKKIALEY